MIGFVETSSSDGMVPIDRIVRIEPERFGKGKAEVRRAYVNGGGPFDLFDHEVNELRMRPAQIIPAQPGIKFLRMIVEQTIEESVVVDDPVVAWALCMDGVVRPVTPKGVCDGMPIFDDHHVEMPDGSVQAIGPDLSPDSFDNRQAMLRHFVAMAKFNAKPVEQSELDRLIADYIATGEALSAPGEAPDGGDLDQAHLAATRALDAYEPQSPDEFVRSLAARFDDDMTPNDVGMAAVIATAKRLAKGEQ